MRYTDWLMLPAHPSILLHPARIKRVEADSVADRAGVQAGDSLIRVNGNAITDILAYRRELENGAKTGGATLEVQQTNGLTNGLTNDPVNLHFTVEWEDPGMEREHGAADALQFLARLDFEPPDPERFPALRLARAAMEAGGARPAILNAANEIAVAAFLERRIGFGRIAAVVERVLDAYIPPAPESIADVLAVDGEARRIAAAQLEYLPA